LTGLPSLDVCQVFGARYDLDPARAGATRVAVVEAVYVGEQDQRARPGDVRDQRREPVVIAEPDLVGRHRVVLVDHGDHAELEQPVQGPLGVPVVAAPHQVVGGEQHLAGAQVVGGERGGVPGDEQPLADARRRLLGGQVAGPLSQPERSHPGGDRAGRDQEDLAAAAHPGSQGAGQPSDARVVDRAVQRRQRGRADLDDGPR
jgi:hypothetical protein